ncbi:MAG: polyamine aminopropyltransferase [Candidatus Melainabacteria bacterium]
MDLWLTETHPKNFSIGFKVKETLYSEASEFQQVDIVDTEFYGRMLLLDGKVMTTEKDEFIYHEMISHIPMLAHPNPKQVLVVGGGDGGTVREVLKHPSVERVVLAEIDGLVIDSCRKYLPSIAGQLGDPRVDIQVGDGAAFIQQHTDHFDVILIDSTDPVGPGERLFNTAFYQNVYKALKDNGVMAAQSESPIAFSEEVTHLYRILSGVFPIVSPYTATIPTYPGAQWLWMFAAKTKGPLEGINTEVAAELEKTTLYYNQQVHRAVFALPNYARKLLTKEGVPC